MSNIKPIGGDTMIEALNVFKSLSDEQLVDMSHLLQSVRDDIAWENQPLSDGDPSAIDGGFGELLETIGDVLRRRGARLKREFPVWKTVTDNRASD